MRSDWGTYGLPTHTPNLDALAKKSVLFEHSYCQISVCAPSRMSFMTGRRPDTFGVWNFIDTVPLNTSATPGHFKDHGYITLGAGKTFHQNAGAWNAEKYWNLDEKPYFPYGVGQCPPPGNGNQGGGHCMQKDTEIYDYHLRLTAIDYLQYATNESKASGRPFYLMCGFRKPHAPWQYAFLFSLIPSST
jgi:iduronate 2-sulfatase